MNDGLLMLLGLLAILGPLLLVWLVIEWQHQIRNKR